MYYVGTLHVPSQSYFPTTSQQCNQEVESVPTTPVTRRQRRRNVDHKQSTPQRTRPPTAGVPVGNHVSTQIMTTSLPCHENKWMPTFKTNEDNIYSATTRVQHFHFWRSAVKCNTMLIEEICNKFSCHISKHISKSISKKSFKSSLKWTHQCVLNFNLALNWHIKILCQSYRPRWCRKIRAVLCLMYHCHVILVLSSLQVFYIGNINIFQKCLL